MRTPVVVRLSALVVALSSLTACGGGGSNSVQPPPPPPNSGAAPTIVSLHPPSGVVGGSSFTLTVTGTNFVPSSVILWNDLRMTTTYVSSTVLTAPIDWATLVAPGTAKVTVRNVLQQVTSAAATFTITGSFHRLRIGAVKAVYDPARQRIYATVSNNLASGNAIAVVNPSTATVESITPVGMYPNAIALSQDGAYLYVGVDGEAAIKRYAVETMTSDLEFPVGQNSTCGVMLAEEIAIAPDNPDRIAVSRLSLTGDRCGLAIFDHDAHLPKTVEAPWDWKINSLAFSDSGATLYGFSGYSTARSYRRVTVDDTGATQQYALDIREPDQHSSYMDGIVYNSGRVYTMGGTVIDGSNDTLVGTFNGLTTQDSVTISASEARAYFLSRGHQGVLISGYATDSLLPVGSVELVDDNGIPTLNMNLLRVTGSRFAYISKDNGCYSCAGSLVVTDATLALPAVAQ